MDTKQVLIYRKDLNSRKGKIAAQCAHASVGVLLGMMKKYKDETNLLGKTNNWMLAVPEDGPICNWLLNKFTKICVSVDSEQDLLDIYQQALDVHLPCCLITDSGLTEFHGVPTNTAVAIGPWYSDKIDKITGHLKLL
jgi:PTH2 family peptidyl-tRNA hydrolase